GALRVLAADHRWSRVDAEVRQLSQRDLGMRGGIDEHALQCRYVVAQLARVAHVEWVPFEPFDGGGDVHAAHRRLDDVLYVAGGEPVARRGQPIDVEVEIRSER